MGSSARTPQGSLCGDNTSLIESRIEELTSCFWVKAGTRLARKKRRRREGERIIVAGISPSYRGIENVRDSEVLVSISQLEQATFIR